MSNVAILDHLAACSDLYGLPDALAWNDTDAPAAAVRLHAFAGSQKWVLVGEWLYYDQDEWGGPEAFKRSLWAYGPGCKRRLSSRQRSHVFPTLVAGRPLFIADTDRIDPSVTSVEIRGTTVAIPRDPEFLAAHAIPTLERGASLYRALCSIPNVRAMLVSSPHEIREALRVDDDVRELLTLDDWAAPSDPERYPESECLALLAEVMACEDPALYRPTETPNMHWRHCTL